MCVSDLLSPKLFKQIGLNYKISERIEIKLDANRPQILDAILVVT